MSDFTTIVPRGQAPFDFYSYNPSAIAGWTFVVLFAIGVVVHLLLVLTLRAWFYVVFLLGCISEVGGYYGRAQAHNNLRGSNAYLLQLFLIIGATPLLSASIYMSLSRTIRALEADKHSLVRVSWLSKIYVLIDIVCLVLQIMGTVMQAYGDSGQRANSIFIIAGGLLFQLIAFVIFILLTLRVHLGLKREPSPITAKLPNLRWEKFMWALYATSALVLLRNLVRVIEFLQGTKSPIAHHEAFLYLFDAVPMLSVVAIIGLIHPGRLVRATRQSKEVEEGMRAFDTPQHRRASGLARN